VVMETFSLAGRRALVTGGSKGLGYTMALAMAQAGADVAIVGRQREAIEAAARKLGSETQRRIVPLAADVTRALDVETMVKSAIQELGHIDILVNNAGINIRQPLVDQSEADFRKILDTNLVGTFLVSQQVGRHMTARRKGSVINVASMLGFVGLAERAGYTASKGAVVQLTRTAALEWAPLGIRVNALCPGPIVTEINTPVLSNPAANEYFVSRIPLGRWGQPHEVGPAVVFLASDASSFMTGAALVIDGGWTAQ
jgi:NAD(P)-dependent dehydrogenase (short-subunit alcohol dehydrogenase family)